MQNTNRMVTTIWQNFLRVNRNKHLSGDSEALNFKIFWENMPPDPLEKLMPLCLLSLWYACAKPIKPKYAPDAVVLSLNYAKHKQLL